MPLINCEIVLAWSAKCVIVYTNVANQGATFEITETNLCLPVVTLSSQDNAKLSAQLKSTFKREITWNKYLSNSELLRGNRNLNQLVEPSFEGVNTLFF